MEQRKEENHVYDGGMRLKSIKYIWNNKEAGCDQIQSRMEDAVLEAKVHDRL